MSGQQRFFPNKLKPLKPDRDTLTQVLAKLRESVVVGIQMVEQNTRQSRGGRKDSIYVGDAGISLMYMRLSVQAAALDLPPEIQHRLSPRAATHLPKRLNTHTPRAGHLSPLDSHVGPAILVIIQELRDPASFGDDDWDTAVSVLRNAIDVAANDSGMGGDEVLYGRAGLLWGMLNILTCLEKGFGEEIRKRHLETVVTHDTIHMVFGKIMEAGEVGGDTYRQEHENGPPLVWEWHGKNHTGAVHGICGILTVLLQCPTDILIPHLDSILNTITFLTKLASFNGHLPPSLPPKHKPDPYVQICHGSPGLLLLLSTFRGKFPDECLEEWGPIEAKASRAVWEQGLLEKGIGVCHGVTGNAWPFILIAHTEALLAADDEDINARFRLTSLSRALTFLVHATEMPPLIQDPIMPYRTPDNPWSMFEGVAGAVCAWADACAVIQACLDGKETVPVLGLPGIGGLGPGGVL